jgi:branched-subunit amino acid transport protein
MPEMSPWAFLGLMLALTALSVFMRSLFFLSRKPWPLPDWLMRSLRFGPVAALVAVVVPEVAMPGGEWAISLTEPRIWGAVAACAYFYWRRELLGTIVAGTGIMLLVRWMHHFGT